MITKDCKHLSRTQEIKKKSPGGRNTGYYVVCPGNLVPRSYLVTVYYMYLVFMS